MQQDPDPKEDEVVDEGNEDGGTDEKPEPEAPQSTVE